MTLLSLLLWLIIAVALFFGLRWLINTSPSSPGFKHFATTVLYVLAAIVLILVVVWLLGAHDVMIARPAPP